jgi:hypothetical protein
MLKRITISTDNKKALDFFKELEKRKADFQKKLEKKFPKKIVVNSPGIKAN